MQMLDTGHFWQSPFIPWASEMPEGWTLLVVHMRASRVKARVPAVLEVLSLLGPFQPVALLSGPLADRQGVFWIALDPAFLHPVVQLLPRLGYAFAVDRAVLAEATDGISAVTELHEHAITWRGMRYNLVRVYEEDQAFTRNQAPDRRTFLLESPTGEVRPVQGYRGSGAELERRGLPVADARLLVNLVSPQVVPVSRNLAFLDPFAGVGGVLIEAIDRGYTVFSVDIDSRLRPGLEQLGARHEVADAAQLPFDDNQFVAIATEPPYHVSTRAMLTRAFGEINRVLAPGGRLALLVAAWQVQFMLEMSEGYGLAVRLASPVNRKGTDVAVLAWEKTKTRHPA